MRKVAVILLLSLFFVSAVQNVSNAFVGVVGATQTSTTFTPLSDGSYKTTAETTILPSISGAKTGALAGAAGGAAIGSFIPVIGTTAGAVIGAIAGGIAGWIWGPAD